MISGNRSLDAEENVSELDGISVFCDKGADGAGFLGFDFIHDLHGLDDANGLADGNGGTDFDEVRGIRGGLAVEGANHGRCDFRAFGGGLCSGRGGGWGCRGDGGRCRSGCGGGKAGEKSAEIIEISPFF